jgi:hypothetical protein
MIVVHYSRLFLILPMSTTLGIDDAQLELADEHMKRIGYLEGHHMAEAFNLLRETA